MSALQHIGFILLGTIFLLTCECKGGTEQKIDSLHKALLAEKNDTVKIKLMNAIAVQLSQSNLDSAILVCKGIVHLSNAIKSDIWSARSYYFLGTLYFLKGDYPTGLKQQLKALQFAENSNMPAFHSQILTSVGNVFLMQGDYDKSLIYYEKAFYIQEKAMNRTEMSRIYSNMGLAYAYQKKTEQAMYYFRKSLDLRNEVPDEQEKAKLYDFMGFAYINAGDYQEALKYLNASLEINRRLKITVRIIDNLRNRGESYLKLKRYSEAKSDLEESLALSLRYGHLNGVEGNTFLLSELYAQKKDFTKALAYFERYIVMRDSMYSLENTRNSMQQEIKFEYDKKAAADSVRVAEEKKIVAAELKHEEAQRYTLYGGLGLAGLFALFMVNRFMVINKQKGIIDDQKKTVEKQKNIMEEKQKEIMDSIRYAKRIQTSHLPSEKYLTAVFKRIKN